MHKAWGCAATALSNKTNMFGGRSAGAHRGSVGFETTRTSKYKKVLDSRVHEPAQARLKYNIQGFFLRHSPFLWRLQTNIQAWLHPSLQLGASECDIPAPLLASFDRAYYLQSRAS